MSRSKHDYDALEREFIQTDLSMSVRQFAADHGISSWSALNVQAIKRHWREKRMEFHAQATQKAIERAGDEIAQKITAIRKDALDVIHAGILKMAFDMQDRTYQTLDASGKMVTVTVPGQIITPDGMAKLMTQFQLLTGNATAISEERSHHVESIDFGAVGPEIARLVADVAGKRVPDERAVGKSSLPGAGRPRTN